MRWPGHSNHPHVEQKSQLSTRGGTLRCQRITTTWVAPAAKDQMAADIAAEPRMQPCEAR